MRSRSGIFILLASFLLLAHTLAAHSIQVVDTAGHPTTITSAQITAMLHVTVDTVDHDTPAKFEGVPLSAVLAAAGVQLENTMRGPRMTEALLLEAADNYKVVYALAELDPDFATRQIILADKRDGKPLDAKEGPFRIVAPGDKRPARGYGKSRRSAWWP